MWFVKTFQQFVLFIFLPFLLKTYPLGLWNQNLAMAISLSTAFDSENHIDIEWY
jgi:hypothetical protein